MPTPAATPPASSVAPVADYFRKVKDPRRPHGRKHLLHDIIVTALCAVIAGADDWQEIATFAEERLEWLRRFLPLANGAPSHDTFERVFDRIRPAAFQAAFRDWVADVQAGLGLKHVAIDGKTLRGSGRGSLGPLHLVSAWAVGQNLSLGQAAVDGKSNEITAIPALLDLLDVNGAWVSIDAMGCQTAIAAKIREAGGHYVLTVKDNQPHLLEDVQAAFAAAGEIDFGGLLHDVYETHETSRGRTEDRYYAVLYFPTGIRDMGDWWDLKAIGMCLCQRTVGEKTSEEVRYFIGSRKASARAYAQVLRNHWGIENGLHWQLDVSFDEDDNRASRRNGAENLALLRRLTLSLLKAHPDKKSIAKKRFAAALNTDFLEEVLRGVGVLGKL